MIMAELRARKREWDEDGNNMEDMSRFGKSRVRHV
jgi:hypothetical protein